MDLKISIRTKKAHESRFYLILNALSDDDVQWRFYREALNFLCIPELEEIVEERICKNKCGYVLCNNSVNIHPTAVVSLNTSKRKIFDISKRKKFCSDWCYGAHKHISSQLSDDPSWKNTNSQNNNRQQFQLYPKEESGCPGEIYYEETVHTVDVTTEKVLKEASTVVKNTTNDSPNEKYVRRIEKVQHVITALDKLIVNKKKDLNEVVQKIRAKSDGMKGRKIMLIEDIPPMRDAPIVSKSESEVLASAKKTAAKISEWITEQTRDYICCTANDKHDDSSDDDGSSDDNEDAAQSNEDDIPAPICLPTIDSANQTHIRKSILIKRMKLASVSVLADFGVDKNDFIAKFVRFIETCRLSPTNIFFTVKEFLWLVILLTDLLAPRLSGRATVNKAELLKKYGISQSVMYDNILTGLNELVYGVKNIAVSSQGDSEEMYSMIS